MSYKYQKISIGIDPAYAETSIGVTGVKKNKPKIFCIGHKTSKFKGCKAKAEKRRELRSMLRATIAQCQKNSNNVEIIVERTGTFRKKQGKGGGDKQFFMAMHSIKGFTQIITTIVDVAFEFGLKVYSVDTRSWKAKVLGSSKSNKQSKKNSSRNVNKSEAIKYVQKKFNLDLSYVMQRGPNKGQIRYNDNIADAICISEYGHLPENIKKLKEEE